MRMKTFEKACQGPLTISTSTLTATSSESGSTITSPTMICPIHLAVDGEDTSQVESTIDNNYLKVFIYMLVVLSFLV